MGWKPWKITHASDYFQELYELAVKLIKIGKAYVCHLSSDDIAAYRERREASPWRDTPGGWTWADDGLITRGMAGWQGHLQAWWVTMAWSAGLHGTWVSVAVSVDTAVSSTQEVPRRAQWRRTCGSSRTCGGACTTRARCACG